MKKEEKKRKPKKQHRNRLITKIMMPVTALLLAVSVLALHVLNFLPFIGDQYIGGAALKISRADGTSDWDADYYDINGISEEDAAANTRDICLAAAEEGYVLLKNENDALPMTGTEKINVFGWAFSHPVYGGSGSGSLSTEEAISPVQGLNDAGFSVNSTLADTYESWSADNGFTARPSDSADMWTLPEMPVTDEMVEEAAAYSDTAIVWIARHGGEGQDEATNMSSALGDTTDTTVGYNEEKHYLELTDGEEAIIAALEKNEGIEHIIVVINSSNAMELGELETDSKVDAILYAAAGGSTGFEAVGEILKGTVNPSGRMTDTYYSNFKLDPTYQNFSDPSLYETSGPSVNFYGYDDTYANSQEGDTVGYATFIQYEEDVYLGYRYYETGYDLLKESQGEKAADAWYYGWDDGSAVTVGSVTDETDTGVVYPFGYGLSYTNFDWEITGTNTDVASDGELEITVKVTNTGDMAGKDVVELYYTAPYLGNGVEKSTVNLGAYQKTGIIAPGASEEVTITLPVEDMASYDDDHANSDGTSGCYVLDAGEYTLSLRTDAHTVKSADTVLNYTVDETVAYETEATKRASDETVATNAFTDSLEGRSENMTDLTRTAWGYTSGEGTFPTEAEDADRVMPESLLKGLSGKTSDMASILSGNTMTGTIDIYAEGWVNEEDEMPATGVDNGLQLIDMRGLEYDDPRWDEFLDQFTVDEMEIMIGQGSFVSRGCIRLGVPNTADNDGPSAIKWSGATGNQTSEGSSDSSQGMVSEVVMACTWNPDLIYQVGETIGTEGAIHGVSGWYAPGLNMHRSPFSGRNFEYFSEDPVLAGTIGAAEVSGVASKGVYAYVKHFVLNDQESYRNVGSTGNWEGLSGMTSFLTPMDDVTLSVYVSEQALREIYLKPFEIVVKTAKTTENYISDESGEFTSKDVSACTAVMSSFVLIGDTWCGANDGLLNTVLRDEWGFAGAITTDASGQPYMGMDAMLFNGGDTMLAIGKLFLKDETKALATGVLQMRRAVHDLCYTKANSNAMNNITPGSKVSYGLTSWQKLCYALIAGTGALFVLVWGIFIKNMVTKKKTKVVIDGYKTTVVEKCRKNQKD